MFRFFKKASDKKAYHVDLMKAIFRQLDQYRQPLLTQLEQGIIVGVHLKHQPIANYFQFSHEVSLLNQHENKKGRTYFLKGIVAYDSTLQKKVDLQVLIGYGIIMGYQFPETLCYNIDPSTIELSGMRIEYSGENDYHIP
jgi:hypothetical protein